MTLISPRSIRQFLAASAIALAVPLAVSAHPGGDGEPGPMMGHGPMGHHAGTGFPGFGGALSPHRLRALDLTESQEDKVFEIMHARMPLARSQFKELRKAQDDLRALVSSPDYDEARAKSLADAIARSSAAMTLAQARTERQIYDLLTPDQRKRLAEQRLAPEHRQGTAPNGCNPEAH